MILLILFLFVIPPIILTGERLFEEYMTHHHRRRRGRYGRVSVMVGDVEHVVEVQEIGAKDGWSRVRVLRVYVRLDGSDSAPTILSEDRYVEWVETDKITWY